MTETPAAPVRRTRWWRWIVGAVAALVAIVAAALVIVDTDIGHRWVADRIGAIRTATGLRFTVGRIDGSLYSDTRLVDLRVYDLDGLVFQAPAVALDWSPARWLSNRLQIDRLVVPSATLLHTPRTRPSRSNTPILPEFDIHIGRLSIGRLLLARPVLGTPRIGRLTGQADIRSGRALVRMQGVVQGTDRLDLRIDAEPSRDRFDIGVHACGAASGVIARGMGVRQPVSLSVGGDGSWARWRGSAIGDIGRTRVVALSLGQQSGRYALSGSLAPALLLHGILKRVTTPRIAVSGTATFADRRLDGRVALRSPALAVETTGTVDLAANAYRDVRIKARLLRPSLLFPNMTGHVVELRTILDGPFDTARFDYRLDGDRFAFDDTGFEGVHAAGRGRLSSAPVAVPIRLTAARVTGIGDVAGGILRNFAADGLLRITPALVEGVGLRVRSDKLTGRIDLSLDLRDGGFRIGISGALGRYLIPGIGIVDVASRLSVVPGPGGHGARVLGQGEAQVVRFDNAFLRGLAGGNPRIVTGLERTPDTILHFTNMVLTAPSLTLAGNGYRRRDGTVHIEAAGRQATYGPVRMILDGEIDHPTLDLIFAAPDAALGLADVRGHLDPTPAGFAFCAAGGSRLGAFTASGAILLPKDQPARIAAAGIDVAGTHAAGQVAVIGDGFDGRLTLTGGGLSGELLFRPVAGVQRIEAHVDAKGAQFAGGTALRQGHGDVVALLDPAGTTIEATVSGQGLRRGSLGLARFAGTARLKNGSGEIRASIAGSQGRGFTIQSVTQVMPDRYMLSAQGTLDSRPLKLLTPAIVTRDGGGWRLAPTRLGFAGGEAQVGGRFAGSGSSIDASMTRLPLVLLDIAYPRLGLGGSASGRLSVATVAGGAPTGRIDMTVRGLTRAGLVLSSRPIDVGIAGTLSADRLGVRAVMASGGKTVGRAQALLSPTVGGDLQHRFETARLFAQLRYGGPADTLWRLTGVELFNLSGPVAIGADVAGTIDAPVLRGVIRATGARIESATTGTVLTNVQASGSFAGSRLSIDRFAGDAGKNGRVTGTGQFEFAAKNGIGLNLNLQADNAVMINRDDIGATVTGPLRFVSDGSGGTISGDVELVRSRYRLGQATAASAVPQLNIREINLPENDAGDVDAPTKPWVLDVHARAPRQVIVSGLGLSSEWSADLKIAGAPDNPAITGRAQMIRGDYEFAGRKFQLQRGIIRFAGDVPTNPALDIQANADQTGLSASINVTGNAFKPEITFTSVPALPQDELLSRLLFGTSIASLSAPEALQLAAAVAALQGGGGLNPINAVRRAAGLDRLRIVPADVQTGQGTSIAAGKYVTRRLYAEIVTDGQGYSATQVEYQVTRWLSLLSSISTLGRQSANVRVSKDY